MEKVPQIRLFSTGQSFRTNLSPSYNKEYKYQIHANTSNQNRPYHHQENTLNSNQPYLPHSTSNSSLQRCNSFSKKNKNPFQTNYYEAAIKICQQNRLLNKHNHVYNKGCLKGAYIQYHNHQAQRNHQSINHNQSIPVGCVECRQNMRNEKGQQKTSIKNRNTANYQNSHGLHFSEEHKLDVFRKPRSQSPLKASQNEDQTQNIVNQSIRNINGSKNDQRIRSNQPLLSQTYSNAVSFRQITNKISQREIEKHADNAKSSQLNLLKTQRSELDQNKNYSAVSLQQSQKINLYNIQKALQGLTRNQSEYKQGEQNVGKNLIDQLEQITRDNIQLKRQYIRKLDQIIEQYDPEPVKSSGLLPTIQKMQFMPADTEYVQILQNSRSLQSLRKRKKLFVTQAQHMRP